MFNFPNGSYSFSIPNETAGGQTMEPSVTSGNLVISGGNVTKTVTFTALSAPKPPPKKATVTSYTQYYEIGLAAVIILVAAAAAISLHHRRRK